MSIIIHLNTNMVIYNQNFLNDLCKSENGIKVVQIISPWKAEILKLNSLDENFKCLEDKYFAFVTDHFKRDYKNSIKLIDAQIQNQKYCMHQEWYKALIYTAINIINDPFDFQEAMNKSTNQYVDALNANCHDDDHIFIGVY